MSKEENAKGVIKINSSITRTNTRVENELDFIYSYSTSLERLVVEKILIGFRHDFIKDTCNDNKLGDLVKKHGAKFFWEFKDVKGEKVGIFHVDADSCRSLLNISQADVEKVLIYMSQEVNKTSPQKIDDYITIKGARVEKKDSMFVYSYVVNISKDQLGKIIPSIKAKSGEYMCNDPQMSQLILKHGVSFFYEYKNIKNDPVGVFFIDKLYCLEKK